MSYLLRLITLILTVVCVLSCQERDNYPGKRTPEERELFKALNDSMLNKQDEALSIIQQRMQQADDSLTWYDYYLMYGRHYMITETPDSALPYIEKTLRFVAKQPPTPRTNGLAAIALNSKAAFRYLYYHPADSILQLYQRAYRLMMKSDMQDMLPDLSANIGDAYVQANDLPNAARWYRRAIYLNDSLALSTRQALTLYMGLGRIYTQLRDFNQARYYYEMTDKRIEELKPNMKSYFLNNYGNFFYYLKDYAQALKTFKRLKRHLENYHADKVFDMYLCKINLADVYLNLDSLDEAHSYVKEAEQFFKEKNVGLGIYYAQTIRIGIALKEKNYTEIERICREEQTPKVSDPDMKGIRNHYLNRYYAAVGDYRHAYDALQDNVSIRRELDESRRGMRSEDIMTRLSEDTIRLHHQLALKQQEISYTKSQLRLYAIIFVLVTIILLTVIGVYYQRKHYMQTRLDIMSLRMLNARQRISPHFAFNVINAHISKSDEKEANQLVMLTHLIRENLDLTKKTIVSLAEELEFVKTFIETGKKANDMAFDFTIEAPSQEKLQEINLPSMMIQILTENAILHGLKNKEGEKKLLIRVEDLSKEIRISVIDNGPGFDMRLYNSEQARTGLNIIRSTISAVNAENRKKKIYFNIHNDNGCHATITIKKGIKYPNI